MIKEDPLVTLTSDVRSSERAKKKNMKNSTRIQNNMQLIDYVSPNKPLYTIEESVNASGMVDIVTSNIDSNDFLPTTSNLISPSELIKQYNRQSPGERMTMQKTTKQKFKIDGKQVVVTQPGSKVGYYLIYYEPI